MSERRGCRRSSTACSPCPRRARVRGSCGSPWTGSKPDATGTSPRLLPPALERERHDRGELVKLLQVLLQVQDANLGADQAALSHPAEAEVVGDLLGQQDQRVQVFVVHLLRL